MPHSKPYRHQSVVKRDGGTGVSASHTAWQVLTKVPRLTAYFWIIKLITTAMGESTSDYMVHQFNPYVAVGIGCILLVATLTIQFTVKKYIAWVYWLAALGVSISGTMGADVMHVAFGVPYIVSAVMYAVALSIIFTVWYKSEHTLSIHSIYTLKREAFYWATVFATFALGTALGDLTAYTLHMGYIASAVVFVILFIIPAILYRLFRLNAVFTFWWAYIATRPLGASIADWTAKAHSIGGLGFGDGYITLVLGILLVGFVGYVAITGKDLQARTTHRSQS